MIQNKIIAFILSLFVLSSCIKQFDPVLSDNAVNKYVVQGMVSSVEGWQTVYVSTTSSLDFTNFNPLNGCELKIENDLGAIFTLTQFDDGIYRVWMNNSDLLVGTSYMLTVKTPKGDILESSFDKMPKGPSEMGDVYYEITNIQTNDPAVIYRGIQFYTDFSASEQDAKLYHWKCTETYEYHTNYPLEFYYDWGGVHQVSPPDYSKMICYRTAVVQNIFTLSTLNLASNTFSRFPLSFVRDNTHKLEIQYSLLVEQTSLSQDAYNYWDKLRINLDQAGGLYTSQPLAVKGNITNTRNADNEVLGFFQASTLATKRIFVSPVPGLELNYNDPCQINPLRFGLIEIPSSEFPAYLFSSGGDWAPATMTKNCVDCTLEGGVTQKPDYWPN
jgi:hypothetical protein